MSRWIILVLVGILTVFAVSSRAVGTKPTTDQADPPSPFDAGGFELPATIADAETSSLVWIDLHNVTDKEIFAAIRAVFDQIDPAQFQDKDNVLEELRQELLSYRWFQQAFVQLGGRGILIGARIAPDMSESTFALIHTAPNSDASLIADAMVRQKNFPTGDVQLRPYAPGWFAVIDRTINYENPNAPRMTAPPTDGEEKYAKTFAKALRYSGNDHLRAAFRMGAQQRQTLATMSQMPEMAMLQGVMQPIAAMNGGTCSVRIGDEPRVLATYFFDNDSAAAQFVTGVDGLVNMGGMFLSMQLQQSPTPPTQQQIANALGALKMKQDGKVVRLQLDKATVSHFAALWPAVSGMIDPSQQAAQQETADAEQRDDVISTHTIMFRR